MRKDTKPGVAGRALLAASLMLVAHAASGEVAANLIGHWTLDGNAGDSSGRGHDGVPMIIGKGDAAVPSAVSGRFGQALTFDGNTAVEIPIDLDPRSHRKLTVTLWVNLNGAPRGAQSETLLSTGAGDGPKITLSRDRVRATGGNKTVGPSDALRPTGWNFVAVSWDHDAGDLKINVNSTEASYPLGYTNRQSQKTYASPRDPDYAKLGRKAQKRYLWLGAKDGFGKTYSLKNVAIDDVRIFAAALTPEQLAEVSAGVTEGKITGKVRFNVPSPDLSAKPGIQLEGDPDQPLVTGAPAKDGAGGALQTPTIKSSNDPGKKGALPVLFGD